MSLAMFPVRTDPSRQSRSAGAHAATPDFPDMERDADARAAAACRLRTLDRELARLRQPDPTPRSILALFS